MLVLHKIQQHSAKCDRLVGKLEDWFTRYWSADGRLPVEQGENVPSGTASHRDKAGHSAFSHFAALPPIAAHSPSLSTRSPTPGVLAAATTTDRVIAYQGPAAVAAAAPVLSPAVLRHFVAAAAAAAAASPSASALASKHPRDSSSSTLVVVSNAPVPKRPRDSQYCPPHNPPPDTTILREGDPGYKKEPSSSTSAAGFSPTFSSAGKSPPVPFSSSSPLRDQHHQLQQMAIAPQYVLVPDHFHYADTSALTAMIADMLHRLTAHNDQIPLSSTTLTRFHSRAPPGISILDYLRRIVKYASVERVCLLILLVYIDRVCERNRSFTISSLTVHRFIITGVAVACKALCDSFLQNSMYAKVGGISTKELNVLEIEFLTLIGWDLTASSERLQDYYRNLVRQHPGFRMVSHHDSELVLQSVAAVAAGSDGGIASDVKCGDWTGTTAIVEAAEAAEKHLAQQGQLQQQQTGSDRASVRNDNLLI
ncbi:hypothetical protein HDU83_006822 [Entophlyctis luteolus]|nr:hypothetical protein HDU83_006822 [Entophlyctis luteolus]